MKNLILSVALLLTGLATTQIAEAQSKIAHINSSELLQAMPEKDQIRTDIEAFAKDLETQMKMMQSEYQAKIQDYEANNASWSDVVRQSKIRAISDLEGRLQEYQQEAQVTLQQQEQKLIEPLLTKAENAIKEVAKANGYDYVLDTSTGAVLYNNESDDLLPLVKKHLGIL